MKTSSEWKKEYPDIAHLGVTEADFFKTEITQEASSLLPHIPEDKPFFGVEVGTWFAKTACILLHRRPLLTLVTVDNWWEFREMKEIALYNLSHFDSRRFVVIDGDSTASARPCQPVFDYVFIDASKDKQKYYDDVMAWFPKIKAGGFMQGHDIDNPLIPEQGVMARKAIERAAKELDVDFTVNSEKYTWMIQK
jgi:predicted O-methyltransferase YrrM